MIERFPGQQAIVLALNALGMVTHGDESNYFWHITWVEGGEYNSTAWYGRGFIPGTTHNPIVATADTFQQVSPVDFLDQWY